MRHNLTPQSKNSEELNEEYLKLFKEYLGNKVVRDHKIIDSFSEEIKNISGFNYCNIVSSGTTALRLLLKALNIQNGSTVITTPLTYSATATAALDNGLNVKYCDVDPVTLQMDEKSIESMIDDSVSVILRVHLNGNYCDLSSIEKKHPDILIIDDAAQIFPIYKKNKEKFSKYCALSFSPSKNLAGMFEAGAVLCDDIEIYKKISLLANNGNSGNFLYPISGENGKVDTFSCSLLSKNFSYIDDWVTRRNAIAEQYDCDLVKLNEIELVFRNQIQTNNKYSLIIKNQDDRDKLIKYLTNQEIEVGVFYPVPLNKQKVLGNNSCPIAEELSKRIISLPIHHNLSSDDIHFITNSIKEYFYEKNGNLCMES